MQLLPKFKKLNLIIVSENNKKDTAKYLKFILKSRRIKFGSRTGPLTFLTRDIIILSAIDKSALPLIKKSAKTIMVFPEGANYLKKQAGDLLSRKDQLIAPMNDPNAEDLQQKTKAELKTFGFAEGAHLIVSDFRQGDNSTNFKINYKGNSVPFWLSGEWSKEETTILLASILACLNFINLVNISQALKKLKK